MFTERALAPQSANGTANGSGREKTRREQVGKNPENPLRRLNIDELRSMQSSLENLIPYHDSKGASPAEIGVLEMRLKKVKEEIEVLEKDMMRSETLKERSRRAKGDFRLQEENFGDEIDLTRGFGHVEPNSRPLMRDARKDGRIGPKPDLHETDRKVGFGHPRAHLVDSDFMPQD